MSPTCTADGDVRGQASSRVPNPPICPVERPTKFDIVVNLKAAEAMGIAIPEPFLRQATEVVQ